MDATKLTPPLESWEYCEYRRVNTGNTFGIPTIYAGVFPVFTRPYSQYQQVYSQQLLLTSTGNTIPKPCIIAHLVLMY